MIFPDEPERKCEQCHQPFKRQYARRDMKFCDATCKQQAYRNRIFEADEAARRERTIAANKEHDRRQRYNANRRKTRKASKPRRSTKR